MASSSVHVVVVVVVAVVDFVWHTKIQILNQILQFIM
jgi:hypothetical protein